MSRTHENCSDVFTTNTHFLTHLKAACRNVTKEAKNGNLAVFKLQE